MKVRAKSGVVLNLVAVMVNLSSQFLYFTCIQLVFIECQNVTSDHATGVLSRKKRWLAFPKGSSLQLVYCWLISTYGTQDGIFTVGITVGLAWEIPINLHSVVFERPETGRSFSDSSLHDRDRRNLYRKLTTFFTKQGEDGLNCVKRAICQSKKRTKEKLNFADTIVHTVFNLQSKKNSGKYEDSMCSHRNCVEHFPCSFSLFTKEFK